MEAAARDGDIESLYKVIEKNPHVLEEIDSIPFVETPLHVSARTGSVEFATEIMMLKPSFAWKLNPQGLRPIHLALQHGHTEMVLRLISRDNELVRAKKKGGLTLLHLASQSGEINLLTNFLKICPDSVKDLTVRNETALHFAVRHQKFEALKFLVRWLNINTVELQSILNQKDEKGNTVLHIAASNNDTEAMKLLINVMKGVDAKNLKGERAFDLTHNEEIKKKIEKAEARVRKNKKLDSFFVSLKERLIRNSGLRGKMSEEIGNAYLVVATLVATATYQAALSPPGGFHQIDSSGTNNTPIQPHLPSNSSIIDEGKSVMSNKNFMAFSTTNMCAFIASTLTILGLLPNKNVAWFLMYASTLLLIMTYFFSMTVISPNHLTTNLISVIFWVLYLILGVVVSTTFNDTG